MQYFDKSGWRVPGSDMRTFGESRGSYYRLDQPRIDYASVLDRIGRHLGTALDMTAEQLRDIGLSAEQARQEGVKPFWRK